MPVQKQKVYEPDDNETDEDTIPDPRKMDISEIHDHLEQSTNDLIQAKKDAQGELNDRLDAPRKAREAQEAAKKDRDDKVQYWREVFAEAKK